MREVSGKIVALYLTSLQPQDRRVFLSGMSFQEDRIPERIDWDAFCVLSARVEALLGGPGALMLLGSSILKHQDFSIYQSAFQLVASPRLIYWASNRWGGPSMFSHITNTLEDLGADRIRITLTIPDGHTGCSQLFAVNQGLFAAMPRLLGLPDALVSLEGDDHIGHYTISMPPSLTLWARLRRAFGVLFSARMMFEELGRQQESLKQRYTELEVAHARIAQEHQIALEARDRAEDALQVKSNFLATISHELLTPINGILGATELLQDTPPLTPAQQSLLGILRQSGQGLQGLVEDILDFAALDAQQTTGQVTVAPLSLRGLLEGVAQEAEAGARQKGLRLSVELDADMPPTVLGDNRKIEKVLRHLLSNAVKFTAAGTVTARVMLEPAKRTPTHLRFEVQDTGQGVRAADRALLFQPFTQAESTITRRHDGRGLGLAICARLVHILGGQIDVQSAAGQGSTFWFTVPLVLPTPIALRAAPKAQSKPPLRILVVEDNLINQQIILSFLHKLHAEVVVASNGQQALDAASANPQSLDLVLMDCHMPVMDGFEASAEIRKLPKPLSELPIIAVTADVSPGIQERCFQAGMNDCINKPITREKLESLLDRWQAHRQSA